MARSDQGGVSFVRRMESAKRDAMHHRNQGRHVGASAKGWNWKRPELDPADWHAVVSVAREAWRRDVAMFRNDFAAACFNGVQSEEDAYAGLAF